VRETHTLCPECDAIDSIKAVPDEGMFDEGQKGGVYRCSECGHQFGVWLDGGILDLGLVRESLKNDDGAIIDVWIHTAPPPG